MNSQTPAANPEVLYRALFEHMLHEVHVWRVARDDQGEIEDWRLVDVNPRALQSWNRSLSEVVGKTPEELFPGSGAKEQFLPMVRDIMATGRPHEWELPFPATGQHLRMVTVPFGEYFISTGLDVTRHKKREGEMSHALAKLRESVMAGNVGLWDWDLRTNQVHFSPEWKRQLGYEDHELSSEFDEWQSRLHPDDLNRALRQVEEARHAPERPYESLFRLAHKDGSYRWVLARASFIFDESGTIPVRLVGSHVDITERKQLEERVEKSQRLEAIGTLAGGIAHDFNNLFAALTINAELLAGEVPKNSTAAELVHELSDALRNARSLTRQLLTFSQGGDPIKRVMPIQGLVQDAVQLMTRGSGCTHELWFDANLPCTEVDEGQVSQVFNNIVLNARQAMRDRGHLMVSAREVTLSEPNELSLTSNKYLKVSVTDQGPGIPDELRSKIFEPFFTTKSDGSGLGLASAHAIIRRHGGALSVDSTPGQGTTFHVYLPASEEPAALSVRRQLFRGTGKLLLMDDDPGIRLALKRSLEDLGYEVDAVENGEDAIRDYQAATDSGEGYHAALLDLTVRGGPGGLDALAGIREFDPKSTVILMTGYADDAILRQGTLLGASAVLQKPFDSRTISEILHQLLTKSP